MQRLLARRAIALVVGFTLTAAALVAGRGGPPWP